jgi:hypothetical protein
MYSLPNVIRMIQNSRMRWAGHVACMEDRKGAYTIVIRKPEENMPYGNFWNR